MFVVSTQCYEDYGYRVKPKGGREIIVEGTLADANAVADLVADDMEHVLCITKVNDDYESDFVKSQREYDIGDTIYLDPVVRKGANGNYYLKRGYIVGSMCKGTQYDHLVGKFSGWVDNLNTGECVCRMEGDTKLPLEN